MRGPSSWPCTTPPITCWRYGPPPTLTPPPVGLPPPPPSPPTPPQSAKMFNYANWRNTCNNIFIVFAAVFIVTRLVILPFW